MLLSATVVGLVIDLFFNIQYKNNATLRFFYPKSVPTMTLRGVVLFPKAMMP